MDLYHHINSNFLDLEIIQDIITTDKKLVLSDDAIRKIEKSSAFLEKKIKTESDPIYGINTGLGALEGVTISGGDLQQLQENLLMSHACGTGDKVPKELVKLMLLLKIKAISNGYSGVQLSTVQRLIDLYNNNIFPVVYTQGALGASGSLSALAHLALPLIGAGEVRVDENIISGEELLKQYSWEKINLKPKEGLALLSGTQLMSAYGVYNLLKAYKLSYFADVIGAISLTSFKGQIAPFHQLIHLIRPHNGQLKTANRIKELIEDSALISLSKVQAPDPYSFRCMPQVHGATKDTLAFVAKTLITEINSVTDNQNIFVEENEIISGGNFHGQPLALALDYLAIAVAELGSISERRTYQLVSGLRGLPKFLISNSDVNSGFMVLQSTAASIVSKNKQYCTPATIATVVASNDQEDHVSMGAIAATKAKKVVDNLETILAIELMTASQALSFREVAASPFLDSIVTMFRNDVPLVKEDRVFQKDIKNATAFIENLIIEPNELF